MRITTQTANIAVIHNIQIKNHVQVLKSWITDAAMREFNYGNKWEKNKHKSTILSDTVSLSNNLAIIKCTFLSPSTIFWVYCLRTQMDREMDHGLHLPPFHKLAVWKMIQLWRTHQYLGYSYSVTEWRILQIYFRIMSCSLMNSGSSTKNICLAFQVTIQIQSSKTAFFIGLEMQQSYGNFLLSVCSHCRMNIWWQWSE